MQRTIYVSGASDDLIEVAGDVSLEADVYDAGDVVIVVNGHDLLTVSYARGGLWRVAVIEELPGITVQIVSTPGEDVVRSPAPPHQIASYSDYAIVTGDIISVEVADESWTAAG